MSFSAFQLQQLIEFARSRHRFVDRSIPNLIETMEYEDLDEDVEKAHDFSRGWMSLRVEDHERYTVVARRAETEGDRDGSGELPHA